MVNFVRHSGIYTLTVSQRLPISLEIAWEFFSSPENLKRITPDHMGFQITSGKTDKMYPGQIISYKVAPLPGITTNWVTEITHVQKGEFFVDEQRFGPYQMWHHEHHFQQDGSHILMTDKVSYKIPLGILGHFAQMLFVKRQLKGIFDYRVSALEEIFGR